MSKMKVDVRKLGKKIVWYGSTYATPCKFYIDSADKTRLQVTMKHTGINESDYTLTEVKDATSGIVEANKKADEVAAANAKVISEAVVKAEVEVVKAPVEVKEEKKEEKGSMTVSRDRHNKNK